MIVIYLHRKTTQNLGYDDNTEEHKNIHSECFRKDGNT